MKNGTFLWPEHFPSQHLPLSQSQFRYTQNYNYISIQPHHQGNQTHHSSSFYTFLDLATESPRWNIYTWSLMLSLAPLTCGMLDINLPGLVLSCCHLCPLLTPPKGQQGCPFLQTSSTTRFELVAYETDDSQLCTNSRL